MIVVIHPTGSQFVRAALSALVDAGLLAEFATTVAFCRTSHWGQWLPDSAKRELLRRSYDIPDDLIHTRPWREAVRLCAERGLLPGLARHETGWASVDAVCRDLDYHVAWRLPKLKNLLGVYAYEDSAYHAFKAAERLGLRRFYDLPIGYWKFARQLLKEEAELQPEWAPTLTGNFDTERKLERKDEELRLADVIFVASSFTRRTLAGAGIETKLIHLVPYGAPPSGGTKTKKMAAGGEKLRVLFVGSLGQRKGLSYLLEAVDLLGPAVELTLIGRPTGDFCAPVRAAVVKYRYLSSLPHHQVLAEMHRHDVFVFPSLFEGFGLVLLEAMSQGLPVITTPNTAGPDIITEGEDGFIVPIRSSVAIANRLNWFAEHREETRTMGEAARVKATSFSWTEYGARVTAAIKASLPSMATETGAPTR